jgi:pimeloyl-ACP methyl ester carboxylesterase
MRYRDAALGVEVTAAEVGRFAAPLLLLHGLWTGSWLWARMTGYLSHRGWETWALDLPGRPGAALGESGGVFGVSRFLARIESVVNAMPGPPVAVTHDAAAALALRALATVRVRALVLLAPMLPGHGALRLASGTVGRALRAILGRGLDPPGGPAGAAYFGTTAPDVADLVRGRLVSEPGRVVYDLLRGRLEPGRLAAVPPALVIGGTHDPVVPAPAVAEAAQALQAEQVLLPGGHWLPLEEGWRETTTCVHRWIVRRLGAELLLLREEEPDPADA